MPLNRNNGVDSVTGSATTYYSQQQLPVSTQESIEYHPHQPLYYQQSIPTNPYNSLDTSNASVDIMEERIMQQQLQQQHRRVLRQSTMPNPDVNLYNSNNNLMPPGSPKQQISPQYSPYNTDNEDVDMTNPQTMPARYGIRRQSTLPCPPMAAHFASTSPNRMYSRSPERNDGENMPRMAPFVRQSTFPSNANDPFQQQRPKLLPTSPNRLNHFNKSPEPDMDLQQQHQQKRYQMMRQATLPNPDQHMKLLPTSPPKKQLSPQYLKRSPEFVRQNTLPNPEGHQSQSHQLNIPQQKFLPISPKHKQTFFFPQPSVNPRTFLSQQNMPTTNEVAPVSCSTSPNSAAEAHQREMQHSKMIKVRSHSNEEYSMSRQIEGRRILPEIPRNRSPRLVHMRNNLLRCNDKSM